MTRSRVLAPPLPEPVLRHIGAGDRWIVAEEYELPLDCGYTMIIPAGFTTDLASIPRGLMWIVGEDDGLSTLAPIVHDAIYAHGGALPVEWIAPYRIFTRREADALLRDLAIRQGAPLWRCWAAWAAVRACAGGAWKG